MATVTALRRTVPASVPGERYKASFSFFDKDFNFLNFQVQVESCFLFSFQASASCPEARVRRRPPST